MAVHVANDSAEDTITNKVYAFVNATQKRLKEIDFSDEPLKAGRVYTRLILSRKTAFMGVVEGVTLLERGNTKFVSTEINYMSNSDPV